MKSRAEDGYQDRAIQDGIVDLRVALNTKNPSDFSNAESHFKDASSVSVVDFYPAFLIQTTRRLSGAPSQKLPPGQQAVLDAITKRDWEEALTLSEALGAEGTKPRLFYEQLITSFQQKRDATP